MSADNPQSTKQPEPSAEELSRLLEIELMQKRAQWQKISAKRNSLRSVSVLFLFLVIVGALAVFYFAFTRASEVRQQRPPQPPASAIP
jgi:cytoskeletal protein RodZ